MSVANIVLLSADEAEARWLRPEEPGRARVGKAQCRERGRRCASFTMWPCDAM